MAAKRKLTQQQEEDVVASYEAGNRVASIAETHGVTVSTVRAVVKRAGLALRPVGRPRAKADA